GGAGQRAGPGRSARAVAQAARAGDHRQLRAPGLPADAAGLLRPRPARQQGPAYPAPAGRGTVLAPALPGDGDDEGLTAFAVADEVGRPVAALLRPCRCGRISPATPATRRPSLR